MDATPWSLTITAQTDVRTLRVVRRTVADIVGRHGGSARDVFDLELALGEALFNAHKHAYRGAAGPVAVDLAFAGNTFTVTVRDEGEPASVPAVPRGAPVDRARLGLYVLAACVDAVDIRQNEDAGRGLAVTMVKRLDRGPGSAATV
jgi:anti-sigma regulatory factor (Ser/Thr protein kinase)